MGEEKLEPNKPYDAEDTRELREEELRLIQGGAASTSGGAKEQETKKQG